MLFQGDVQFIYIMLLERDCSAASVEQFAVSQEQIQAPFRASAGILDMTCCFK